VMLWTLFALITPLFGRIGCGWFCPFGTIQDLAGPYAFYELKSEWPFQWLRLLQLAAFIGSGLAFYFLRLHRGAISGVTFAPFKLSVDFNQHYKLVWMIDAVVLMLLTLAVGRRGLCRIGCPMGGLCAIGSKHSRLIPVVDLKSCTSCGQCEKECPGKVPMMNYIKNNQGQVADSECLNCGKCVDVCRSRAVRIKMQWKRNNLPKGRK